MMAETISSVPLQEESSKLSETEPLKNQNPSMDEINGIKILKADNNDGNDPLNMEITEQKTKNSATMPLYGKYSDIYGRRNTYLFSLLFFLIGSIVCGASINIWYMIGFRGFQGIGGGGLISLSMVLIGDITEPSDRAKYMSSMSG